MQINWRHERKGMLRIAVAYVAFNIFCVSYDNGSERIPVDIAVSVLDASNSEPVSQAVASWQPRPKDFDCPQFDCQHIVDLLNESAKTQSSKGGILSPRLCHVLQFAFVANALFGLPDKGIPMNVIGMTTKNGRLEFQTHVKRDLQWALPQLGPVDASDRILQVDAVGYQSKQINLRQEDFHCVEGPYRVDATVLLHPETAPR